jgi:hypothetical protein
VKRQLWLCPVTVRLVRRFRALEVKNEREIVVQVRAAYRDHERAVVRQCAWLGQNIRFPLVGIPGMLGVIAYFLWLTIIPLNVILVALLVIHEQRARVILDMMPEGDLAAAQTSLGSPVRS